MHVSFKFCRTCRHWAKLGDGHTNQSIGDCALKQETTNPGHGCMAHEDK